MLRTVVALRILLCSTSVIVFALSAEGRQLEEVHSHLRCHNRSSISVLKRLFFLERRMNDVCLSRPVQVVGIEPRRGHSFVGRPWSSQVAEVDAAIFKCSSCCIGKVRLIYM